MSENPPDDARFTDREVRLIFERAGELQTAGDGDRRFTLAELKEIGVQAGLSAEDIANAAATIRVVQSSHRFLGAPRRFHSSIHLGLQLSETGVSGLVSRLREIAGRHGELRAVPGGFEWKAASTYIVSFTPTKSGTRADILVSPQDDVFLTVMASGALGMTVGVITAMAVGLQAHGAMAMPLLSGAVAAGMGTWATVRVLWARAAKRWTAKQRAMENAVAATTPESD